MPYPKRLIEVDLPIKRISAHARREKSIRHGHISTLHIWWARRPLAACRAVLCASLWPDPADPLCPKEFIEFAQKEMIKWSDNDHLQLLSKESIEHFIKVNHNNKLVENKIFLRTLLLDFIADFANWDNCNNPYFLSTTVSLVEKAHSSLFIYANTKPLVFDPFAGGGAIPFESLKIGTDVFASDSNPLPFLINKLQLEYLPRNSVLVDQFKILQENLLEKVTRKLTTFYPTIKAASPQIYQPTITKEITKDNRSWRFERIIEEIPVAYLWSRTIKCEGPKCGIVYPLVRSKWLAKKSKKKIGFKIISNELNKSCQIEIVPNFKESESKGTIVNGKATCPHCGFVMPLAAIRKQLVSKNGGTADAMMLSVITQLKTERTHGSKSLEMFEVGKYYRIPNETDFAFSSICNEYLDAHQNEILEIKQKISLNEIRRISLPLYGIDTWDKAFTNRQLASIIAIIEEIKSIELPLELSAQLVSILACVVSKVVQYNSSMCRWKAGGENLVDTFGRQAIPIVWDFAEANIIGNSSGNITDIIGMIEKVVENISTTRSLGNGTILQSNAQESALPDDSIDFYFTDPPYYDAIPYSHLSDFIYTWTRTLLKDYFQAYEPKQILKESEIVVDRPHRLSSSTKDILFYESQLKIAFSEGLRVTKPRGIANIVFASKTTASWEAILGALINSGWIITGSWPIDTEMETKVAAIGQARLMSSVHLVCRPRENEDGSLIQNQIGDWRDVQQELPKRIHEWMPRLAAEGVAGADAIFACLGPALEVFSRYSSVEKPNGDVVTLREYLEKVWAAVSQEALNMVFTGGEAQGLEEDARLTAMWLWTLTAGASDNRIADYEEENDDDESSSGGKLTGGFTLEYDTARKIAQGLGANLEELKTLVEVKGDKARLLPVLERTNKLFGSAGIQQQTVKKKKKVQLSLSFENMEPEEDSKFEMPELKVEQTGKTVLDRLHQAMLLFSTGRTEALKRFLVEDGVGKDDRFWKLAQSLTSLYPKDTDERRWVEAVQTYKKSLGF